MTTKLDNTPPVGGCGNAEPFALRVLGDSMEPEFPDGCVVVIDPGGVVENGSYIVAESEEGLIFRQLRGKAGAWRLVAVNSGYPELQLGGLSKVVGVVVQRAGTRRHQGKIYGATLA